MDETYLENTVSQRDRFVVTEVSEAAVQKELSKLKRKNATGIDNLPPGMLKDAAPVLAKPLTHVINLSLKSGIVPTDWKIAKVIPLHNLVPNQLLTIIDQYQSFQPYRNFLKGCFTTSLWLTLKKVAFSLHISLVFDQNDPQNRQ